MSSHDSPRRPAIAVIGAGPAGLMAAEVAARGGAVVTVHDRMPSVARKFLLAGRGGLNLTHDEPLEPFVVHYGAAAPRLAPIIAAWTPDDLRGWSADLGQPTFVGTSGRVFPRAFKTSPLLRAWLRRLDALGVALAPRHDWRGWDAEGRLVLETPAGPRVETPDATILALGGASWPRLGADGSWVDVLARDGVGVAPLAPANCGFVVPWSDHFRARFEGTPLKGIALSLGAETRRGEALVTRTGIEGGVVYALSAILREAIAARGAISVHVAPRPDLSHDAIAARLGERPRKQSLATHLRKALGLPPVVIALLREAEPSLPRPLASLGPDDLARLVQAVPLRLVAPMPIARAISSAGGVRFACLDDTLMLRHRPGTFVAGEMLDWEAPTGGYLLQACFATGAAAAHGALAWLEAERRRVPRPPSS